MRKFSAKTTRKLSQRQELRLAQEAGGLTQKGSGNLPWAKGDVRSRGRLRAECKFTRAQSFTVKRAELNKIRSECSYDETPVFDVAFLDKNGRTDDRWVLVPYEAWLELEKEANAASKDQRANDPTSRGGRKIRLARR